PPAPVSDTLSLHDALPISAWSSPWNTRSRIHCSRSRWRPLRRYHGHSRRSVRRARQRIEGRRGVKVSVAIALRDRQEVVEIEVADRKSTPLNSSHSQISYG